MSPDMGSMEQGLFDMMQEIEGTEDFKSVFLQRSERENRKFQQFINLCKGLARQKGRSKITCIGLMLSPSFMCTAAAFPASGLVIVWWLSLIRWR